MLPGSLPASGRKGLIGDELNSTILNVFLWGRRLERHLCILQYRTTDIVPLIPTVIDLIMIGLFGADHLEPSDNDVNFLNHLNALLGLVTFATTLSSTTLIAYRIYTTLRDIPGKPQKLPIRILEFLVQSAAAYSLEAIAQAISSVVPQTRSDVASWAAAGDYTALLFNFTSGIAQTVLVARVALLDEQNTQASAGAAVSAPLSELQFQSTRIDEGS
ncbi:hypothetical protein CVT26_013109 [Gymnopilus dilepis]|uniref:Uncharacterized protein n=1 Tax=Gymnopilus dilepis TaxID=231916 RepID=A0A409YF95_9AGAR|nr:hypothetical protein CVT26_013109 [Gymnopilus dilepis]